MIRRPRKSTLFPTPPLSGSSVPANTYSSCIRLQDGSSHYFTAQCMSFKLNVGSVDSITAHTAQLEIDNDIIEVPAISFTLAYTAGANGSIVGVASQTVLQGATRSEEHTLNSSHSQISYAVFCLKKKKYH